VVEQEHRSGEQITAPMCEEIIPRIQSPDSLTLVPSSTPLVRFRFKEARHAHE